MLNGTNDSFRTLGKGVFYFELCVSEQCGARNYKKNHFITLRVEWNLKKIICLFLVIHHFYFLAT